MMFPLGLSIWRRHQDLLPFFWSANGITSMLASVLGMAVSIEFGIAKAYALGVCFYAVCALMIVLSHRANRIGMPAARPVEASELPRLDEAAAAAACLAPSIRPTQIELAGDLPDRQSAQVDRSSEQVKA
jgi:hypothetical protein